MTAVTGTALTPHQALAALLAARGPIPTRLAFVRITMRLTDHRAPIWCENHKRLTNATALYKSLRYGHRHLAADVWWASAEQAATAGMPHIDDCWETT